ncbi:bifunctional transcriptional activator/DNA repair enzyme AdaA [Gorillibacterium sp. sgz5001074]|uniref:bifunctional transcriptional activator/DNA repair enzyme AdaA n=1 Tax=Gorillibacterium sp. sgz5001074 TaxID=3446695 RepID=UPI003F67807C
MNSPIRDPELVEHIYASVSRKETVYDGIYYTGVHTTGIFCRPSCRARTPLRRNVSFYPSAQAALEAGFRPCKRCRPETPGPDNPDAALVKAVREAIRRRLPGSVTLATLAAELHLSPYYLQRVFKRTAGVSPAEYALELRVEEAKRLLTGRPDLSAADIARMTGFSSPAYFSTAFLKAAGVTPTEYRLAGGLLKN